MRPAEKPPLKFPVAGTMKPRYHLLEVWPAVRQHLRTATDVALFLDFDGTLAPIRRRPEEVKLDLETRQVLQRLLEKPRLKLWIISGRGRADLRRRVGLRTSNYLGIYGWQGSTQVRLSRPAGRLLRGARGLFKEALAGLEGIWLEDKKVSFAIHYRGATERSVQWARQFIQGVMRVFEPDLRMLSGKMVWEILPREIPGKGDNLRRLMAAEPLRTLPIIIGDDKEDEEAFCVLSHAITVRVGSNGPTHARYFLNGPKEVRKFLEALEAVL